MLALLTSQTGTQQHISLKEQDHLVKLSWRRQLESMIKVEGSLLSLHI